METIFEGMINGVKYDDITAYNDRIKELISKGEAFSASTSSRTIEKEIDLFPHGKITEDEGKVNVDLGFIDESNNLTLSALRDELADKFAPIVEALDMMNEEELNDYITKLEALGDWFEATKAQNEAASKSVKARIEDIRDAREKLLEQLDAIEESIRKAEGDVDVLVQNLSYLNKSDRTIAEWYRAYENIYHAALEELKNCTAEHVAKTDVQEKTEVRAIEKTPVTLRELWECIFGK